MNFGKVNRARGVAYGVQRREYAEPTATLGGTDMDQAELVTIIDEALERFAGRDLVASSEVVDLLLDLRSAVVSDAAIAALIEAEAQPAR
jgi:hypothetical protein